MVMGPTHAMSGLAGGLALSVVVPPELGGPSTLAETATVGIICAGSTLLPDIDNPRSTVARSYGTVSTGLAELINGLSAHYCNATRSPRDEYRTDGHRGITHTVWFALATGLGVGVAAMLFGIIAVLPVLFVTTGLAVRGLMANWVRQNDWIGVATVSAVVTLGMWLVIPDSTLTWLTGLALVVGMNLHYLGDLITRQGCPLLAPFLPIKGKNWWDVALPPWMRISAGGLAEMLLVLPALGLVTTLLALLVVPGGQALLGVPIGVADWITAR